MNCFLAASSTNASDFLLCFLICILRIHVLNFFQTSGYLKIPLPYSLAVISGASFAAKCDIIFQIKQFFVQADKYGNTNILYCPTVYLRRATGSALAAEMLTVVQAMICECTSRFRC